jgi:hypothetical protein
VVNRRGGGGSFEWSFPIESIHAAGGFFRVGERVQILGTVSKDGQTVTEVVNPSALIIAMDRSDPNPFRGSISILLSLNSQAEVFRMQNALDNQKLTVVRGIDQATQKPETNGAAASNQGAKSAAPTAGSTEVAEAPGATAPTQDSTADSTADPSSVQDPAAQSPAPTNPANPS